MFGLAASLLLLLGAAGVIALVSSSHSDGPSSSGQNAQGGGSSGSGGSIAAEAQARDQAAAWVAQQVSHDVIVSCDPLMCQALIAHGMPSGDVLLLKPGKTDPLGSELVVSTAAVRSMFGSRLSAVYAPAALASFGSGTNAIVVRQIASNGAAAFTAELNAEVQNRKTGGLRVLDNQRIVVAGQASVELSNGEVDSRLLDILVTLGDLNHLRIVGFGDLAPGASQGIPLRSMDLGAPNGGSWPARSPYAKSVTEFLRQQVAPYRPATIKVVQAADGEMVLRVAFAAPSPFGLMPGKAKP